MDILYDNICDSFESVNWYYFIGIDLTIVVLGRNESHGIHVFSLSGKYQCGLCKQFTHRGRQNVLDHVEAKHLPNPCGYQCNVCSGVFRTSRALYRHNLCNHRNK